MTIRLTKPGAVLAGLFILTLFVGMCLAVFQLGEAQSKIRRLTAPTPTSTPAPIGTQTGDVKRISYGSQLWEESFTLSDGRTVSCVIYSSKEQGGMSCLEPDGAAR